MYVGLSELTSTSVPVPSQVQVTEDVFSFDAPLAKVYVAPAQIVALDPASTTGAGVTVIATSSNTVFVQGLVDVAVKRRVTVLLLSRGSVIYTGEIEFLVAGSMVPFPDCTVHSYVFALETEAPL